VDCGGLTVEKTLSEWKSRLEDAKSAYQTALENMKMFEKALTYAEKRVEEIEKTAFKGVQK
jgi:exonuclease VII small subunit